MKSMKAVTRKPSAASSTKGMKAVSKKPAAAKPMKVMKAVMKKSRATSPMKAMKAAGRPSGRKAIPPELQDLVAHVVNLERRPDRWSRVSKMLKKETPWLDFQQLKASDGTQNPIPEAEVVTQWNTSRNSRFADYYEWAFVAPGDPLDGTPWKFAADVDSEAEVVTQWNTS